MSSIALVGAGSGEDKDRIVRLGGGLSTTAGQSAQEQNESRQVGCDRSLHATSKVFRTRRVRRSGTWRVLDTLLIDGQHDIARLDDGVDFRALPQAETFDRGFRDDRDDLMPAGDFHHDLVIDGPNGNLLDRSRDDV